MLTSRKHVSSLTLSSSLRTLTHTSLMSKSDVHRCHSFSLNSASSVQLLRSKSNWCWLTYGRALAVITRVRVKSRLVTVKIFFAPYKISTIKTSWTLIENRQLISTLWILAVKPTMVFFSRLKKSSISLESTSTYTQIARINLLQTRKIVTYCEHTKSRITANNSDISHRHFANPISCLRTKGLVLEDLLGTRLSALSKD